jgi:hypothetical protein
MGGACEFDFVRYHVGAFLGYAGLGIGHWALDVGHWMAFLRGLLAWLLGCLCSEHRVVIMI